MNDLFPKTIAPMGQFRCVPEINCIKQDPSITYVGLLNMDMFKSELELWCYSKASRYTASRCTDLDNARF